MIFTAYFDESDTHGQAPTIIMAAFLAHAYQWKRFAKKLKRLQAGYGFTVFHAKEFKAKTGEFVGWPDEKCLRLINDLTELVRDNLTEGIVMSLDHSRYTDEYRSPPIPKGMNLDSQYGVCFRACLGNIMNIVGHKGKRTVLDVVIENGHANVGDTVRIFNETKQRMKRLGSEMLGEIKVAKKGEAFPLMVADFLAHTYSMMQATKKAGVLDYAAITPEPPRYQAGLTFLELLPNALKTLKEDYQRLKEQGVENWRERRKAKKLSSV